MDTDTPKRMRTYRERTHAHWPGDQTRARHQRLGRGTSRLIIHEEIAHTVPQYNDLPERQHRRVCVHVRV